PGAFFRTPFIRIADRLVGLSPWHMKDHASFGTWGKLNAASKKVLKTDSNQRFTATCARRANLSGGEGRIGSCRKWSRAARPCASQRSRNGSTSWGAIAGANEGDRHHPGQGFLEPLTWG